MQQVELLLFVVATTGLVPSACADPSPLADLLTARLAPLRGRLLPGPPPLRATADADEYFDRVLSSVRSVLVEQGLDPLKLPDETLELLGTGVRLHDGHLDGLTSVHRTGEAVMFYQGEWLGISGHVGFSSLGAGYSAKIEVLHIGPDVTATASIKDTSIFFSAKISSRTLEIELVNFSVENAGHIDVTVDGLGIFDWLLGPISEAISNILEDFVVDIINKVANPLLKSFLASIDLLDILENLL